MGLDSWLVLALRYWEKRPVTQGCLSLLGGLSCLFALGFQGWVLLAS